MYFSHTLIPLYNSFEDNKIRKKKKPMRITMSLGECPTKGKRGLILFHTNILMKKKREKKG